MSWRPRREVTSVQHSPNMVAPMGHGFDKELSGRGSKYVRWVWLMTLEFVKFDEFEYLST
jgi:hypothetical protein